MRRPLVSVVLALAIPLLAACTESESQTESTTIEADDDATLSPKMVPLTVTVTVATINVLGQSCEALSGVKEGLHTGAVVTLESAGEIAGVGRLGEAARKPPKDLCAWDATISANLLRGEIYQAVVADRFTSDPASRETLQQTPTLSIEAK